MGQRARDNGAELKRGELWWADLGAYRPREQTGRRPVVICLAGTALIDSSPSGVPPEDSVALAFQMRAILKSALQAKIRDLVESEVEGLELATDEALGRVEPK